MTPSGRTKSLVLFVGVILLLALGLVGWPSTTGVTSPEAEHETDMVSAIGELDSVGVGREVAKSIATQLPPTETPQAGKKVTLTVLVRRGDTREALPNLEVWHLKQPAGDERNFESLIKKAAKPFRSGDDGILKIEFETIPYLGFIGSTLFARHDNLVGHLIIPLEERENLDTHRFILELFPEASISIRTIRPNGMPAPNIEVSRSWITRSEQATIEPSDNSWLSLRKTNDPDGILAWKGMSLAAQSAARPGETVVGVRLRARVPGHEGVTVELQPLPTDGSMIDLQLPQVGQLTVQLFDPLGRPAAGRGRLNLRRIIPDSDDGIGYAGFGISQDYDQGKAHFPTVALNSLFELSFRGRMGAKLATKEIAGPTDGDLDAVRTLTLGENLLILRGRALDAEGEPIASKSIFFNLRTRGSYEGGEAKTGDGGLFLIVLPGHLAGKELKSAHLFMRRSKAEHDLMHLTPFRRGLLELGDVVLEETASLLTGRVIAAPGAPCSDYRLRVEHRPNVNAAWQQLRVGMEIDEDSFRIRGVAKDGDYRLTVTPAARCHIPPDPIEFVPGTKGLNVWLERGHTLAVLFRIPKEEKPDSRALRLFEFVLRPIQGPALDQVPTDQSDGIKLLGSPTMKSFEQESYWNGLVEGTYQLEALIKGASIPFRTVGPIRVPGASGQLARATLDLTGGLKQITLSFESIDGSAPEGRVTTHLLHNGRIQRASSSGRDAVSLTVIPGAFDAWILAKGYKPILLRSLQADQTVVLTPSSTPLRVHLDGHTRIAEGVAMRISLNALDDKPPGWQFPKIKVGDPNAFSSIASPFTNLNRDWPMRSSGMFKTDGHAQFDVHRPGRHTIKLELIPTTASARNRWSTASVEIEDFAPNTFDLRPSTETQTLTLQVTQTAIDRALRSAGRK